ncbi:N,N'-diacetylchitobiase [Octopus sinensis]|uniref:beta-N-acetylhexosaminidase n=1 Tax=Octopus sinensis TaxID=2607531 RepID=A0A6P7SB61_9MOLL|nr:N,N'-diacetylchitobiase [Octopus sinensis]XP_036357798.1 N,N'-diacetylchitobiase [Octopus sinensis]
MDQKSFDLLTDTLDIHYEVLDNIHQGRKIFKAAITLTNHCSVPLEPGPWAIYLCHIRLIEPKYLSKNSFAELTEYGVKFSHVNGSLFKLEPLESFKTLTNNDSVKIIFLAQYYSVAKTDVLPNWYMTYPDLIPRIIKCTADEDLNFVGQFNKPSQWKRYDYELADGKRRYDIYDPFTPKVRFERNLSAYSSNEEIKPVIPTPLQMVCSKTKCIYLREGNWVIYTKDLTLSKDAEYLSGKLQLKIVSQLPETKYIYLKLVPSVQLPPQKHSLISKEAYTLTVDCLEDVIEITASTSQGLFWGIQSLLSLYKDERIPEVKIVDAPRYEYRGLHVDVVRNFHGKQEMFKLIDSMIMYKMNKLHLHLTDDEGWRIEIPGLEEMTSVGGYRGHNASGDCHILPLLGSGPNSDTSGSGYYSVKDYREILLYATERHVEIIPEVDMPGHCNAAIQAVKSHYEKLCSAGKMEEAAKYMLHESSEVQSSVTTQSCQLFHENLLNPGLESTFNFVEMVVLALKEMHEDIAPLRVFHFGGDEVPIDMWEESPACRKLFNSSEDIVTLDDLLEHFVRRVAAIVYKHGLSLGAWQDGMVSIDGPFERSSIPQEDVLVYAWQNVWESGKANIAYMLANAGYKVVMSQATHLYFDHPYEPDPEERGLYWAARFIDTEKVFKFIPDDLYANADYKLTGEPLSIDDIKTYEKKIVNLKVPENIIGIQGQLWSELVRTSEQLECMVFPRLIAMAERAWHKASWEDETDKCKRDAESTKDWASLAKTLGTKELSRLEQAHIAYHLVPPGARFLEDGRLEVNCTYPGLPIQYSIDNGETWTTQSNEPIHIPSNTKVLLQTSSTDRHRSSRQIELLSPNIS